MTAKVDPPTYLLQPSSLIFRLTWYFAWSSSICMRICLDVWPKQASLLALLERVLLAEQAKGGPSYRLGGSRSGWSGIVIDSKYQLS